MSSIRNTTTLGAPAGAFTSKRGGALALRASSSFSSGYSGSAIGSTRRSIWPGTRKDARAGGEAAAGADAGGVGAAAMVGSRGVPPQATKHENASTALAASNRSMSAFLGAQLSNRKCSLNTEIGHGRSEDG